MLTQVSKCTLTRVRLVELIKWNESKSRFCQRKEEGVNIIFGSANRPLRLFSW